MNSVGWERGEACKTRFLTSVSDRILSARSNIRNDGVNAPELMQKRANSLDKYEVRYKMRPEKHAFGYIACISHHKRALKHSK